MKYDKFEDFLNSVKDTITPIKEKWAVENKILTKKYNKFKIFIVIFDIILFIITSKYLAYFNTPDLYFKFAKYALIVLVIIMIDAFLAVIYDTLTFNVNKVNTNKEYKDKIINKMLENFVDELEYDPQKGIDEKTYKDSLYDDYYDDYKSEDYFTGKINNQFVKMSDVYVTEEVEEEDKDGNKHTRTEIIFNGLFGKVKLSKSIGANVQITPNGSRFNVKGSKRLDMDSREFESIFDVYTNNPIVAMQILTVNIEEDMAELQKTQDIRVEINIMDDNMYILFHTNNMFEIYRADEKGDKALEKYFEIMKFITKIINKITQAIDDTSI